MPIFAAAFPSWAIALIVIFAILLVVFVVTAIWWRKTLKRLLNEKKTVEAARTDLLSSQGERQKWYQEACAFIKKTPGWPKAEAAAFSSLLASGTSFKEEASFFNSVEIEWKEMLGLISEGSALFSSRSFKVLNAREGTTRDRLKNDQGRYDQKALSYNKEIAGSPISAVAHHAHLAPFALSKDK